MQTISLQTTQFIKEAFSTLDNMDALRRLPRHYRHLSRLWYRDIPASVSECANLILELEDVFNKIIIEDTIDIQYSDEINNRYPIIHENIEAIPIYKEAIILERHSPIVSPKQIPSLLHFLKIPSYKEGLEVENHNFGYHFHYGKVKSNSIIRTNILFTFDSSEQTSRKSKKKSLERPILYVENHAEGKNKIIDVDTIVNNKRLPIYLVCIDSGEKRGLENFKRPSKKAKIFYSDQLLA